MMASCESRSASHRDDGEDERTKLDQRLRDQHFSEGIRRCAYSPARGGLWRICALRPHAAGTFNGLCRAARDLHSSCPPSMLFYDHQ